MTTLITEPVIYIIYQNMQGNCIQNQQALVDCDSA